VKGSRRWGEDFDWRWGDAEGRGGEGRFARQLLAWAARFYTRKRTHEIWPRCEKLDS